MRRNMTAIAVYSHASDNMKTWQKAIVGSLAVVGALYIALWVFLSFGISPQQSCTVYPVMSVNSPDGRFRAEQRQEICNEDGRVTTTVQLSKGWSVNVGGRVWNVFRAPSAQPIAMQPGAFAPLRLELVWLSNSELQISYPRGIEVVRFGGSNDIDVKVRYRELVTNGR